MTRETKVGLGVAVSFLALVGGVLGYKLYFEPNQGGQEEARQASKPSGPIKFGSAPKKFEPPTLEPKPAGAPEVVKNDGKEPPTPEAPPSITLTSTPPTLDPPSLAPPVSSALEPSSVVPKEGTEKTKDPPSLAPPALTPPPLPPPASEPPALDPPKTIAMPKPSEPPLSPPSLAPPTLSPVKETEKPGVEISPPPIAPGELDPPTLEKKADPPPPPPPPSTAENPPRPMITIGTPVPAPNTFDRKYDAPLAPRVPVADPAPPSTPPSEIIRPMPKADHWQPVDPKPAATPAPGVPVTIKRQPDEAFAPAPLKGVPLVVPKTDNAVRPAGSSPVEVRSFDYELYQPQAGDTFATISLAKYKSDRYHQALAQFNRERDPQMVAPQPGKAVLIPPADHLESRYPQAIPGGVSSPKPMPEGAAGSRYPTEDFTKEAASADWAKSGGGEKQYRVQKDDTIWSIAKRTLGAGDRWPDILKLNRDALRDVNQLPAGMVLRLPADAKVDGANLPQ